jgi:predicted metal-dependent hydrolase
MNTRSRVLTVSGVSVEVVRKAIKNLHLGVYPPDGRVRVAVPLVLSDSAVRVAVIGKLRWIRRQQATFARQPRQPQRLMVAGESHFFLGNRYRLTLVETHGRCDAVLRNRKVMEIHARPQGDAGHRARVLLRWYRERLRELVPPLVAKWEGKLGVRAAAWGIKMMKTKWGTCNPRARRIWLNLELAKKPPECLEYIVIHELVHILVRHHDDQFHALMDRHFPRWRQIRRDLNAAPLAHAKWSY